MSGRRLTKYKKHKNHALHAVVHSKPHALPKRRFNKKPLAVGLLCALVLIGIGAFVYMRIQNNTSQSDALDGESVAISALIDRAKNQQSSTDAEAGQKLAEDIVNTSGYENSQDLLAILVEYYIDQGNPTQARKYYTKLATVYNSSKVFSESLGVKKSMEQLESDVIFIEARAIQFKESNKKGLVSQ